jgi:transketolase
MFSVVPLDEFRRVLALRAGSRHDRAALFGTLIRLNVLYMIARAGSGHIGTSFSSVDLVSWLHLHELRRGEDPSTPLDVYFSSKGHDAPAFYAVMIALERLPFELVHELRRLNGLPGHPDVGTPGVAMNTGSLGMGISKAKGVALANRQLGIEGRVYVLTGDGELQEGQNWEALQQAANAGLEEVTAIVDRNRIQSDTWVRSVNDYGDLPAKFGAFGWHVVTCDGHDPSSIEQALADARAATGRPSVVIAETVKGKGVSFMEGPSMPADDQLYHFHSGAPSPEAYERGVAELLSRANAQLVRLQAPPLRLETVPRQPARPPSGTQRFIPAYARALVAAGERDRRLVALDADLVLDCGLIPFRDRFPERFVECGIAEQDMVSMAGGMAARGLLPIAHSFTCFLSSRPNEQIYNNATERRKVVYVGSLAGLLPGGPGHSHQCVRDISSLGAIPHLVMIEPSCEQEVEQAVDWCVSGTRESCYLRLVSITVQVPYTLPEGYRLREGEGVVIRDGDDDVVAIGYGPIMLTQAWKAAERLQADHGVRMRVINLPWLNRVDRTWLRRAVSGAHMLFTFDNHYLAGGQGEMLLSALLEGGVSPRLRVRRFGVERIPDSGQNEEVLAAHGLDAVSLTRAMVEELSLVGR